MTDNKPGSSIDNPQVANLVNPLRCARINDMDIDMHRFAEAAERLGADKEDILSIDGYINSKGNKVPDYDSVKIVKRAHE